MEVKVKERYIYDKRSENQLEGLAELEDPQLAEYLFNTEEEAGRVVVFKEDLADYFYTFECRQVHGAQAGSPGPSAAAASESGGTPGPAG